MKLIQIRVSDETHRQFKALCASQGTSMQDAIAAIIAASVSTDGPKYIGNLLFGSCDPDIGLGAPAKLQIMPSSSEVIGYGALNAAPTSINKIPA